MSQYPDGIMTRTPLVEQMTSLDDMQIRRIGAMFVILLVSLSAVSFPGLSTHVSLRIPRIVFFVGKHFGTGVILATAFCHLLQDAYTSLQDPEVRELWDVAPRTGLVILGSLLLIFLVEYISTSYVDRLHAEPSAPPTPVSSPARPSSPIHVAIFLEGSSQSTSSFDRESPVARSPIPLPTFQSENSRLSLHSERAPLITAHSRNSMKSYTPGQSIPKSRQRSQSFDHPYLQLMHSNNPRYITILGDRDHHRCCCMHDNSCVQSKSRSVPHGDSVDIPVPQEPATGVPGKRRGSEPIKDHNQGFDEEAEELDSNPSTGDSPRVGRRRQVVGILVLQLGIMIHSLVIGLTLSITSAPDFTPLVTAIIFHQLFEGLSLGIRIAALPPLKKPSRSPFLAPTLSTLFAITTPAGILIGLLSFSGGKGAQLRLTQGLMSAISAGMLIYASCVEMLAGDFVMDPHMHMGNGGVQRQIVALSSLLLGVAGMALID